MLGDGGWFDVRKCQRVPRSVSREPAPPFGSYVPLGLRIVRGDVVLGVDVGGTFTDVVAVRDGRIEVTKVPSEREPTRRRRCVEGARAARRWQARPVFNHASTMGLNAVITRALPKVAFLTTDGPPRHPRPRPDLAAARPAERPVVAALRSATPPGRSSPATSAAASTERLLADGTVHVPLDEAQARRQLAVLERCNVEGVAICLLNSYVNPEHEERLRELVRPTSLG